MENRNKDIHRIQEIRHLLESRQRFFCEKLNETWDNKVALVAQQNSLDSPDEHSIGASIEANLDSSSSTGEFYGSSPPLLNNKFVKTDKDGQESSDESGISDAQDVNVDQSHYCADNSDNSSSHNGSADENGQKATEKRPTVKLRRRKSKSGITLRKEISTNNLYNMPGNISKEYLISPITPSPSSITFRKKSVSFDDSPVEEMEEELVKKTKKKSPPSPAALLRKQSYLFKMEIAKKLDRNAARAASLQLSRREVLGVSNGSLARAREKLELAEKSLRNTVKTTENVPMRRVDYSVQLRRHSQMSNQERAGQSMEMPKKGLTRLQITHAEKAFKNDLNLREAFALIKINPDPIIDLAPMHIGSKGVGNSGSSFLQEERAIRTTSSAVGLKNPIADDTETTRSLRRLTNLSVHHQKRQKSLIPDSVNAQIFLEDIKDQSKKLRGAGDSRSGSSTTTFISPARKTSTPGIENINQKMFVKKKRSKDLGKGPKLAFSGLEASLRAERYKNLADSTKSGESISGYHYVQKLSGTIL